LLKKAFEDFEVFYSNKKNIQSQECLLVTDGSKKKDGSKVYKSKRMDEDCRDENHYEFPKKINPPGFNGINSVNLEGKISTSNISNYFCSGYTQD
jgi:hypothetical protein